MPNPRPAPEPGLLIVDKPPGMTSHDVVARVRKLLGTRKIGHAGTLDPSATGVLVLGVGRATKLLGHLALDAKSYTATIVLGAATSTDDADGEVLHRAGPGEIAGIRAQGLDSEIAELTGTIAQVPSAVSAVKVGGVRAYAKVRAGEEVELEPRPVTVHRFARLATRWPEPEAPEPSIEVDVVVDCTSGTYVRALARDLGSALGVGGHLAALRRTVVGPFDLAAASTLEQLAEHPGVSLGLGQAVRAAFPARHVDERTATGVRHGGRLPATGAEGPYGVFDPDGHVLALAVDEGARGRLLAVLDPA